MFIYFHQYKFRYDKGQIAPLMILVLVILIIMAMVTVNIYKVAMDKTYSANAVDAGALAAGSVMANVFNAIASSNAEMKKGYELAFYSIQASISIALVYISLASAAAGRSIGLALSASRVSSREPCLAEDLAADAAVEAGVAAGKMKVAASTITSAIIATSALYTAQLYFYGKLRETAAEGRASAIEQGHKFLFYNGGVGSRLPEVIPEGSLWNKSRKDFSRFLDTIDSGNGENGILGTYSFDWADSQGRRHAFTFDSGNGENGILDTYRFDWQDGQGRQHFAESVVRTGQLDAFDLIVTVLPFSVLLGLLLTARGAALASIAFLTLPGSGAVTYYAGGAKLFKTACAIKNRCHHPACKAIWRAVALAGKVVTSAGKWLAGSAITSMVSASIALVLFRLGIIPLRGVPVRDSSMSAPAVLFILCWIDDIIHDRRLRVESTLSQEGADLGLIKTEYPLVKSYSVVDFQGSGKILPKSSPDLSFDASIIETDVIGNR